MAPKKLPQTIDIMKDILGEGPHTSEQINAAATAAQEALSTRSLPQVLSEMKTLLPEGASPEQIEQAVRPAQVEVARKKFKGTSPEAE